MCTPKRLINTLEGRCKPNSWGFLKSNAIGDTWKLSCDAHKNLGLGDIWIYEYLNEWHTLTKTKCQSLAKSTSLLDFHLILKCKASLRFSAADIREMAFHVQILPVIVSSNDCAGNRVDIICNLLQILRYANRLCDIEPMFGRPKSNPPHPQQHLWFDMGPASQSSIQSGPNVAAPQFCELCRWHPC